MQPLNSTVLGWDNPQNKSNLKIPKGYFCYYSLDVCDYDPVLYWNKTFKDEEAKKNETADEYMIFESEYLASNCPKYI